MRRDELISRLEVRSRQKGPCQTRGGVLPRDSFGITIAELGIHIASSLRLPTRHREWPGVERGLGPQRFRYVKTVIAKARNPISTPPVGLAAACRTFRNPLRPCRSGYCAPWGCGLCRA